MPGIVNDSGALTIAPLCPVCERSVSLLKQEERGGRNYRSFLCGSCRSIFCPDQYSSISPDYVDRVADDITQDVLWCQGGHKKAVFDQLFRILAKRRIKIRNVLDIGCGTGGFLSYMKSRGIPELYGFDASAAQVRLAQEVSPNARTCVSIEEYIRALGYAPNFDLIALWDVLEHIREPRELLSSIRKHSGPDTVTLFCTPNGIGERVKLSLRKAFSVAHSFFPWEHVLYYTPKGIRLMLEEAGFEIVYLTGALCYNRSLSGFEILRRAAFAATRRTPLVPQLFVLARKRV